ncbi:MAG: PorT family protein, partial [Ferruginibacter sp.]|nr:PorT family protein [Ferruginibacter sp.]
MKRILFSVMVWMLVSTGTTFAQGFSLGVKAGADINKLDGTEFKNGFSFGYQLGAFAEIKLSKKF